MKPSASDISTCTGGAEQVLANVTTGAFQVVDARGQGRYV